MRRLALLSAALLPLVAAAQELEIPYQARLVDVAGAAISGSRTVTVILRDGGGAELWRKDHAAVPVADGYVSLVLSGADDHAPPRLLDAAWFSQPVFFSVAVDGSELGPSQALGSTPRAAAVVGSVRLQGNTAPCTSALTGTLRWASARVEVCNGSSWMAIGNSAFGLTAGTAVASCDALFALDSGKASGSYWIDPDGAGSFAPFQAHCDMGSGGGWTQILRLAGNGQITGTGRESFWATGGNLDTSWAMSAFSKLESGDRGFVGWSRLAPLLGGTVELRVVGTNALGQAVDETYALQSFAPNMADSDLESGAIVGGGTWSVSKDNDAGTRNGWGACGTSAAADSHVGLGLCVDGYNVNVPVGREVQVWHYGDWSACVNVSFGHGSTGANYTYPCGSNAVDLRIYLRE